jgi:hypothetical protein
MAAAQDSGAKTVRDRVGAVARGIAYVASATIASKLTVDGTKCYLEAGMWALCGGLLDTILNEIITSEGEGRRT